MISVPLLYYPMKLLFVDDDEILLNTYHRLQVPNRITTSDYPIDVADDPFNLMIQRISASEEIIGESSNLIIKKTINFNRINEFMTWDEKYDIIGTIITDYQMPTINGIDYLKKITQKINKILLTGVFSSDDANEAYASNIIDYYIRKDAKLEKLINAIKMVETRFFISLTKYVMQPERLMDKDFISIFDQVCGNSKEHWIINEYCGYKFIDDSGKIKILNIYSTNDLVILGEIIGTKFTKYTIPDPYNMQESTTNVLL